MHNGEGHTGPSSSSAENDGDVGGANYQGLGAATEVASTTVNPPLQEEKDRVFAAVERVMDLFRKGERTRFQASTEVIGELDKWRRVSDSEKTFNSYLSEINSHVEPRSEDSSAVHGLA